MTQRSISVSLAIFFLVIAGVTSQACLNQINRELRSRLSAKASIVAYSSAYQRWSTYHAPRPGIVVNVAEEQDVVETVRFCIKHNLDFLAQSGGHGFAITFNLHKKDVLINMRGLNQTQVSDKADSITFGGGALVSEVINAAYENNLQIPAPSCNCVGIMGAILGGGITHLMGRYGLLVDNLLSVNLVTADGKFRTVSATSSPDLWWAIRGAGANFGIVTSATLKAYPEINNGNEWTGALIYTPDKLEEVVQAVSDFDYKEETAIFLVFAGSPPDFAPALIVSPFYSGNEADAKDAFKAFYDLAPVADLTGELPVNEVNTANDAHCTKGPRKPVYSAGLNKLDPQAFREIWNELNSLISNYPALRETTVLVQCYSLQGVQKFSDDSAAFPHRNLRCFPIVEGSYEDAKLDSVWDEFGKKVRKLWLETSGLEEPEVYVNYSRGDEDLDEVYGKNLARLKQLKKKWDKHGRFSQYHPIPSN